MSLAPGARLGAYEVVALLGAGGMGEVYKALDTRLDRTVAIKVLPAHVAGDPALRQRFEREARAIAALNHPHICTLHDVGSQDGTDYLVIEYLEGETLAQRLAKGGAVPRPVRSRRRWPIPDERRCRRHRRLAHQPRLELDGELGAVMSLAPRDTTFERDVALKVLPDSLRNPAWIEPVVWLHFERFSPM